MLYQGGIGMKYLYKKGDTIYVECSECKRVMKFKEYQLPEVKEGIECFCGNLSNVVDGIPVAHKQVTPINNVQCRPVEQKSVSSSPMIKCPTCGSTKVKKITLTSKAVGGAMFGLFSSNIRNTFKCEKCGYKW